MHSVLCYTCLYSEKETQGPARLRPGKKGGREVAHAGASPHHARGPLERGGKGNGRERDLGGGGGTPGGVRWWAVPLLAARCGGTRL